MRLKGLANTSVTTASFGEAVRIAFDSLRASKLRSFLTLLGIILATTTLIAVMSVIHGMDIYIAQNVSDMGADGFRIVRMAFIGNWDPKKFLELQRKNPFLKKDEYQFLKERAIGGPNWPNNGLSLEDNRDLFKSTDPTEVAKLVAKGLRHRFGAT